jgi:hypothetical protein
MNPAAGKKRDEQKRDPSPPPALTPTGRGVAERKAITATIRAADEQAAAAAREESEGRRRRESEELATSAELAAAEAERTVAAEKQEAAADAQRLARSRWFGAMKQLAGELSPRFLEKERGLDLAGLTEKAAAGVKAALEPAFAAWRAGQPFAEAERLRRVREVAAGEVETARAKADAKRAAYDEAMRADPPDPKLVLEARAALTAAQAALRGNEGWLKDVQGALAAAEAASRQDLHARVYHAAEQAHAEAYAALAKSRRRCEQAIADVLPEAALQRRLTELLLPERALRGIPQLNTQEPRPLGAAV